MCKCYKRVYCKNNDDVSSSFSNLPLVTRGQGQPCPPTDCYLRYDFNNCQPIPTTNTFGALLNGRNEIPPNTSTANGTLIATLSCDGTRLDFVLRTFGLLPRITAAHFHQGNSTENGPVVKTININPSTGDAVGSWTSTDPEPLTPQLVNRLKTGGLYVNVHTTTFPGGEIRGQVYPIVCNGSNSYGY